MFIFSAAKFEFGYDKLAKKDVKSYLSITNNEVIYFNFYVKI